MPDWLTEEKPQAKVTVTVSGYETSVEITGFILHDTVEIMREFLNLLEVEEDE